MFHCSSKSTVSGIIVILVFLETANVCADCGVGFFNNSLGCIKCPDNDKYCNSSELCLGCKVGFSGIICQNKCNNCQNSTRCSKDNVVYIEECKDGQSGKLCDKTCDSRSLICCRINVFQCLTYKSNRTFELAFPADCPVETRNTSDFSDECLSGYWGDSCEQNCSSGCNRGGCDRENGTCSEGCKDGFSGQLCDIVCLDRCQSCDRSNATKCLKWKKNEVCPAECHCIDGCTPGYWGERCDQNCSAKCSTGRCDRENGTCSDVTDDSLRYLLLETSVVLLSSLLVVMTSAVICLLYRQRKNSDTRRVNDNQKNARRPSGEQISAISSEAYTQHSREHGATRPSTAANEYIVLTDASCSENQYLQLPIAVFPSLVYDEDLYGNTSCQTLYP